MIMLLCYKAPWEKHYLFQNYWRWWRKMFIIFWMLANLATLTQASTPSYGVDVLEFIVRHFNCPFWFCHPWARNTQLLIMHFFLSDMKLYFEECTVCVSLSKHTFSLHSTTLKPEHVVFIKAPCLSLSLSVSLSLWTDSSIHSLPVQKSPVKE